jgi:hypothetical protein
MLERIRHKLLKKRRLQVAYWDLVERAEDHLRALDEQNEIDWRLSETRVAFDLQAGKLYFQRPNGAVTTAELQCVGALQFMKSTWTWAWDLQRLPSPIQADARKVREYGERHQMPHLTAAAFRSTEVEAWGLTAVACLLNRADGAYRLPVGDGYIHVLYRNLSGARPQGQLYTAQPTFPEADPEANSHPPAERRLDAIE